MNSHPQRRTARAVALMLAVACLPVASVKSLGPHVLAGQAPPQKPDTGVKRAGRLFRAADPVVMWLSADFKTVFKDRDSMSTKTYPATLRWLGDKGDTLSTEVQLSTRGHYRLKASSCAVPPLKVKFDKEKTKGTLFGGEGSLKLTTHCQKGENYAQNVYVEYAVYGMYNALTPLSLKARLATIGWSEPGNPSFAITRPGFWTEDDDGMAARNKGKILTQQGGHSEDMDQRQMTVTDLFQYMIGNTDFSLLMLHNYRIVQTDTSTSFFPVAYDFDWSGMVDAPYARPDYRLPIKRVIDRLYRGGCHTPALLTEAIALFKAKKSEIYGALSGIKALDPRRLKEGTGYLDEFFKTIDDPREVKREFMAVCSH